MSIQPRVQKDDLLDMQEAARMLGVHHSTVRRACEDGRLKYVLTPGGRRRILRSEVERLLTPLGGENIPAAQQAR